MPSSVQTRPSRSRRRRSSRRESDGFDAEARVRTRALLIGAALAIVGAVGLALVFSGVAEMGWGTFQSDHHWAYPAR